jgi:hypothetical protein
MAKALLGYSVGSDPRLIDRLTSENRLLRQRVADLENRVRRLQEENDTLVAVASESFDQVVSRDDSLART